MCMHSIWLTVDQKFPVHHWVSTFPILHDVYMESNELSGRNEHGWAILSNNWQIETAFRAQAEIADWDR